MKTNCATALLALALAGLALPGSLRAQSPAPSPDLWKLANDSSDVHRFSTLFTAHDVPNYLGDEDRLERAIDWCKKTGITKVYIEEFRDGYQAERATLENAKKKFQAAGFEVSGCVTTTKVGKSSTGWKDVACCYTDAATQEKLRSIFEYAASMFDEIMIDDFWFTDCTCNNCDAARRAKTVTIGEHVYPVSGDSWEDYRCELMTRLSTDRLLGPAKRVNPNVRLIIKYPQWYDNFHERGYDVARETAAFDRIWVGTETRDYADQHWGGTPQYEGFFIMRWLGGVGGDKCGGGWFDSLGTTTNTYIEQARQTILGGARESMLFAFGSLRGGPGPADIDALRANEPELFAVARQVRSRQLVGLAAYKPPNSHPGGESRVFDFVGMIGFPLAACHEFPTNAPAAFFSVHALKDPDFAAKLNSFIKTGKPVLLTDGLALALTNKVKLDASNVHVLPVNRKPKALLDLSQKEIDDIRAPLLKPFHTTFRAPNRVALYLFGDGSRVVENFSDETAIADLNGRSLNLPPRGWVYEWK